jgi:hypothetical protein
MKKLYPAIMVLLFCCQPENKEAEVFPSVYYDESNWVIYEGIIPLESGEEITMELSLRPGSPGLDSDYRLEEWNQEHNSYMMGRHSANKYTTLTGSHPDEVIIKLHNSKINREIVFGSESPEELIRIQKSLDRTTDLFFKSKGNELVLVDDNFEEINPQKYSLIRRSKTFTVEGYVTFVNDTFEFFEMNTRENWALADRGLISKARSNYYSMAKEKFEGVYIKGLAYSVDYVSSSGKEIDALVLRNIYDMRPGTHKSVTP